MLSRCLLSLCVSALCLARAQKQGNTKPNFIFFQPDEMRAESVGCYGHPIVKTPNMDAFAKQSTRFNQAHVSYTVTISLCV